HHDGSALAEREEEGPRLLDARFRAGATQYGHAAALRQGTRRYLVAEQLERRGGGSDKDAARLGSAAREAGLLTQESVARVYGVAPRVAGNGEKLIDVEVGLRAASAERSRRVDVADMEAGVVVLGEDPDGLDAEVGGRARDADRDLAPIRHEKTGQGQTSVPSCSTSRSPSSSVLACSKGIRRWTPTSSYRLTVSAVTGGGGVAELSTSRRSGGRSPSAPAAGGGRRWRGTRALGSRSRGRR